MNRFLLLILGISVLVSCLDTAFDKDDIASQSDITYLDYRAVKDNFSNDPFRIISVSPLSESNWSVIVEYSGGCFDHIFYTWWSGDIHYSLPAQAEFFLLHNSLGDLCEAIVRDTLLINVDDVFNGALDEQTLVKVINETVNQSILVDPILSNYVLENACTLPTEILNSICGQSIWGNRWLKLEDSLAYHDDVWFQPVKENVEDSLPEVGDYRSAVTLMFGYDYAPSDVTCNAIPEGLIVPVRVDCLIKQ